MSKPDRVISMISIAAKGRNLVSGEFAVEKAVKCGKAYLVVVAEDASDNTKKQFRDMCEFYEVPMVVYGNKDTLGHFIGTQMRANIAITDEGIANSILKSVHNGK